MQGVANYEKWVAVTLFPHDLAGCAAAGRRLLSGRILLIRQGSAGAAWQAI
jgi:hypothetical protein